MTIRLRPLLHAAAVVALAAGGLASPIAASADEAKEQFIPLATFRVGPYASSGIPVWAGLIDTLRYINEAQGGINGVKLFWDECETEWQVEKGVECYERFKNGEKGSPVAIYLPNGDPIAKALLARATADKIPIPTLNYGPTRNVASGMNCSLASSADAAIGLASPPAASPPAASATTAAACRNGLRRIVMRVTFPGLKRVAGYPGSVARRQRPASRPASLPA